MLAVPRRAMQALRERAPLKAPAARRAPGGQRGRARAREGHTTQNDAELRQPRYSAAKSCHEQRARLPVGSPALQLGPRQERAEHFRSVITAAHAGHATQGTHTHTHFHRRKRAQTHLDEPVIAPSNCRLRRGSLGVGKGRRKRRAAGRAQGRPEVGRRRRRRRRGGGVCGVCGADEAARHCREATGALRCTAKITVNVRAY